ncbi:MAG: branched-chain amino acid transporter permease, partial [Microbacteriaceae bacterium]|nr:branched-chain amino acid transporter permease [Microbacteriaceae bacterium]
SPIWSDFTFFIVLLLVLLVRPRGLFGARTRGAL